MLIKYMIRVLGILFLTSSSHYCGARTWYITNGLGKDADITIKLAACAGKNPTKHIDGGANKSPITVKGWQEDCCISGIQVNGKDVSFKAITQRQRDTIDGMLLMLLANGIAFSMIGQPVFGGGLALLLAAGAGLAAPISEVVDRCSSREIIVATDGAYIVGD